MGRKRTIVVNGHFQLKIALSIALTTAALSAIVVAGICYMNNQIDSRLISLAETQTEFDGMQKDLYESLIYVSKNRDKKYAISEEKVNADKNANSEKIQTVIADIEKLRTYNKQMIVFTWIGAFSAVVLIFLVMFRKTSGIAGQMKLLRRYLSQINKGEVPQIRALRTSDSFHDVFEELSKMAKRKH